MIYFNIIFLSPLAIGEEYALVIFTLATHWIAGSVNLRAIQNIMVKRKTLMLLLESETSLLMPLPITLVIELSSLCEIHTGHCMITQFLSGKNV
jgi:hypothetical protein